MEQPTTQIETFAIVEIMGHLKLAGMVKTEPFGAVMMLRVDVPELPERREKKIASWDPDTGRYFDSPQLVEEVQPAEPGYTRYFGMQSIFSLTPCDEATARESVERLRKRPAKMLRIGEAGTDRPLLESSKTTDEAYDIEQLEMAGNEDGENESDEDDV